MDTLGRRWLRPALRVQAAAATGLMAGFCALAVAGVPFSLGVQVAVLLGGIVVTGFPHGAFDHWVAQTWLKVEAVLAAPLAPPGASSEAASTALRACAARHHP